MEQERQILSFYYLLEAQCKIIIVITTRERIENNKDKKYQNKIEN